MLLISYMELLQVAIAIQKQVSVHGNNAVFYSHAVKKIKF